MNSDEDTRRETSPEKVNEYTAERTPVLFSGLDGGHWPQDCEQSSGLGGNGERRTPSAAFVRSVLNGAKWKWKSIFSPSNGHTGGVIIRDFRAACPTTEIRSRKFTETFQSPKDWLVQYLRRDPGLDMTMREGGGVKKREREEEKVYRRIWYSHREEGITSREDSRYPRDLVNRRVGPRNFKPRADTFDSRAISSARSELRGFYELTHFIFHELACCRRRARSYVPNVSMAVIAIYGFEKLNTIFTKSFVFETIKDTNLNKCEASSLSDGAALRCRARNNFLCWNECYETTSDERRGEEADQISQPLSLVSVSKHDLLPARV
ncbi:hypothetical protein EAG_09885 [Camponotus floridanus]|uniref:Uncharacterized protein n=1 Tax=Camponotus floridanus TaxID=104421 RepID=E2A6B1_CAMFO|nr:hypothetical protein EAG_09885 [Camponotus floridanus]